MKFSGNWKNYFLSFFDTLSWLTDWLPASLSTLLTYLCTVISGRLPAGNLLILH